MRCQKPSFLCLAGEDLRPKNLLNFKNTNYHAPPLQYKVKLFVQRNVDAFTYQEFPAAGTIAQGIFHPIL